MGLNEWKIEARQAYMTAVLSEDANGLMTATIDGEIVPPIPSGDSDIPREPMPDNHYGPVIVRAVSRDQLPSAIEKKIESDGLPIIRWLSGPD